MTRSYLLLRWLFRLAGLPSNLDLHLESLKIEWLSRLAGTTCVHQRRGTLILVNRQPAHALWPISTRVHITGGDRVYCTFRIRRNTLMPWLLFLSLGLAVPHATGCINTGTHQRGWRRREQ